MTATLDPHDPYPLQAELDRLRGELVDRLVRRESRARLSEIEDRIRATWAAMEAEDAQAMKNPGDRPQEVH